jgi:hypothetical protein
LPLLRRDKLVLNVKKNLSTELIHMMTVKNLVGVIKRENTSLRNKFKLLLLTGKLSKPKRKAKKSLNQPKFKRPRSKLNTKLRLLNSLKKWKRKNLKRLSLSDNLRSLKSVLSKLKRLLRNSERFN